MELNYSSHIRCRRWHICGVRKSYMWKIVRHIWRALVIYEISPFHIWNFIWHIWKLSRCIYDAYMKVIKMHIWKINMTHICYLIYDAYMIHFSWVLRWARNLLHYYLLRWARNFSKSNLAKKGTFSLKTHGFFFLFFTHV